MLRRPPRFRAGPGGEWAAKTKGLVLAVPRGAAAAFAGQPPQAPAATPPHGCRGPRRGAAGAAPAAARRGAVAAAARGGPPHAVRAAEDAMPRRALEVGHATNSAFVLADASVQLDAYPLAVSELRDTQESHYTRFQAALSIEEDALTDAVVPRPAPHGPAAPRGARRCTLQRWAGVGLLTRRAQRNLHGAAMAPESTMGEHGLMRRFPSPRPS